MISIIRAAPGQVTVPSVRPLAFNAGRAVLSGPQTPEKSQAWPVSVPDQGPGPSLISSAPGFRGFTTNF